MGRKTPQSSTRWDNTITESEFNRIQKLTVEARSWSNGWGSSMSMQHLPSVINRNLILAFSVWMCSRARKHRRSNKLWRIWMSCPHLSLQAVPAMFKYSMCPSINLWKSAFRGSRIFITKIILSSGQKVSTQLETAGSFLQNRLRKLERIYTKSVVGKFVRYSEILG